MNNAIVMETWVDVDGSIYKLWDDVLIGKWPEADAPIVMVLKPLALPWEKVEA